MKKIIAILLLMCITLVFFSCKTKNDTVSFDGTVIKMSSDGILVDGKAASSDTSLPVYIANDIVYYEDSRDFTYGEGTEEDAHSKEEAESHTVVHIAKEGNYMLTGELAAGQIAIDLGKDAKSEPDKRVFLTLNNAHITCSVAPGIIFYNVYECSSADEENATKDVDTSLAGANIIIADGSENTVNGSYVARIYKEDSVVLSQDGKKVEDAKKLHKYDGAVYSRMTMNVYGGARGDGILNINAENEGLDSELHLTINGGNININSGNDGINTNEDYVSVTTVNGGSLNIFVNGGTGEGDGIDSNGYLVINGGEVFAQACGRSADSGIDSDMGIYINGGEVFSTGNMLDRISESNQTFAVFTFEQSSPAGIYTLKNQDGDIVAAKEITNSFRYLIISSETLSDGEYTLWKDGIQLAGAKSLGGSGRRPIGGPDFGNMTPPEGFEGRVPEGFEGRAPEGFEGRAPEGFEGRAPEGFEGKAPEGFEGKTPKKEYFDNQADNSVISEIFEISAGENYFDRVKEAE